MTGRIVVGLTDSDAGRRALAWAAQRAKERRIGLSLVTVIGGAVGAVGERVVVEALAVVAREYLDGVERDLRAEGIDVVSDVLQGNPVAKLIDASTGADLLVIGSDFHPGRGQRRGVHGVQIAAGAHSPVVVVPELAVRERRGVVVGVDGSETSEHAIRFAAAEADRLGEPLIAVSVWTPVDVPANAVIVTGEYLNSMQQLTEEIVAVSLAGLRQDYPDLEMERRVERGYPSAVISHLGATARLTVVGTHGRGRLARFLLGSISHEVLGNLTGVTAVVR